MVEKDKDKSFAFKVYGHTAYSYLDVAAKNIDEARDKARKVLISQNLAVEDAFFVRQK